MEIFRFLGVADDAPRHLGGPLQPMQMFKLPGTIESIAEWKLCFSR